MNKIIEHSTDLSHEIDDCITNLIKARLDKNADKENEAIWNMERLMTTTMQHISWLVGELKGNSQIKWQTGEARLDGLYIVTYFDFVQKVNVCRILEKVGYRWMNGSMEIRECNIKAWCRISQIKPYKEETK